MFSGDACRAAASATCPKVTVRPDGVCVITLCAAAHSAAGTPSALRLRQRASLVPWLLPAANTLGIHAPNGEILCARSSMNQLLVVKPAGGLAMRRWDCPPTLPRARRYISSSTPQPFHALIEVSTFRRSIVINAAWRPSKRRLPYWTRFLGRSTHGGDSAGRNWYRGSVHDHWLFYPWHGRNVDWNRLRTMARGGLIARLLPSCNRGV
jgi:hypothetical protein